MKNDQQTLPNQQEVILEKLPDEAIIEINSVLEPSIVPEYKIDEGLDYVLMEVLRTTGITLPLIETHFEIDSKETVYQYLKKLSIKYSFKFREVNLTSLWWKQDNGPILGRIKSSGEWCALLPTTQGRYHITIAAKKKKLLIHEKTASDLIETGYIFYRTLPNEVIHWYQLLRFSFSGYWKKLIRIFAFQFSVSFLGLFTPFVFGKIVDVAIPNADLPILLQFILGLMIVTLVITLFKTTQQMTMTSIKLKISMATQAALWERVLRLPLKFIQSHPVGDLTVRLQGMNILLETLTEAIITLITGGITAFFTLALMFYYSTTLALLALGFAIITTIINMALNILQLMLQNQILIHQGQLTTILFACLSNMSKLRVANSEPQLFGMWVKKFSEKTRFVYHNKRIANVATVFNDFFSIIILVSIFAIMGSASVPISFGDFIAFNGTFGLYIASSLSVLNVFNAIPTIIPLYERLKPSLTTLPEINHTGLIPDELRGAITLKDITFAYHEKSRPLFNRLSLQIKPGEFVALVGQTGSGKSTLLKLLLGFLQPQHGAIFYDDYKLSELNLDALRKQLGVVLQNGALASATILENIVGDSSLTLDDAWEAARWVQMEDTILALPMGMHTLLIESGKTFSAGQRQRLMLARALIRKPRILLLDEATSNLDNINQAEIERHLSSLSITRIIVAHRLSTIIHANRIIVLSEGKIVQMGSYSELVQQEGMFASLIKRQLTD